MELLERYLNEIKRYLTSKDKEDTIKELKELLLDDYEARVENGESEEDAMYNVIKEFGDPKQAALKYRNDEPIIARALEPMFYLIAKIVAITAPLGILLASSISFVSHEETFNIIDLLVNAMYTVPEMFSGSLTGVGIVFLIFFGISRIPVTGEMKEEMRKANYPEFDPKLLPKVPDSVYKVSMVESLIGVAGAVLFIYILNYQPGLISVYFEGERLPLLNDNFMKILPIINVSVIFAFAIDLIHVIRRRRSFITCILELVSKMFGGIILFMLASRDIFNEIIINGYNLEIIPKLFVIGMIVGGIAAFLAGIVTFAKVIIARSGQEEYLKEFIKRH